MRVLAASAVLLLFLAGCDDADPESDAAPPAADTDEQSAGEPGDDDELADASEVLDDRAAEGANAQHLEFGDVAEHGEVAVVVRSASWGEGFESGDSNYRDLILDVRFENRGEEDAEGPLITAHCRGQEMFSNQHEGPIGVFDPLPAGTAADGEAIISVDLPCEDGWLAWSPEFDEDTEWRWPMPVEE